MSLKRSSIRTAGNHTQTRLRGAETGRIPRLRDARSGRSCVGGVDTGTVLPSEKVLLMARLGVIPAENLTRLENADVEPELREPTLPFEGAVDAKRPRILPMRVPSIQHEP